MRRIDDPVAAATPRVGTGRTVVARITHAVPVPVLLGRVPNVRAVVLAVRDAVPVAVVQHGHRLDRLAVEPRPAARGGTVEVQGIRADGRGAEGPLVVDEVVTRVVRGQVRRCPGAEEHRVRAEDLEREEIASESPEPPPESWMALESRNIE